MFFIPIITGKHSNVCASIVGMNTEQEQVFDAFGNELQGGDSVQLIKPLPVKGTKIILKKGLIVKNIRLTNDPDEIDCSTPEVKKLVLRTEFVKKK